jgi:hypothetical protein
MEITNEIKAKVFAPYVGVEMKCIAKSFQLENKILSGVVYNSRNEYVICLKKDNHIDFVDANEWIPILKPLSQITDEDAIEVASMVDSGFKLSKKTTVKRHNNDTLISINTNEVDDVCMVHITLKKNFFNVKAIHEDDWNITTGTAFKAYQYLQSRGYDLPNYLLGGKTLQEAGLAIYQ